MKSVYKRRRGIEWENGLYRELINYLQLNKICIANSVISIEDLKNLSIAIFPKYGDRKKYQENVWYFLQQYSDIITEDVSGKLNFK